MTPLARSRGTISHRFDNRNRILLLTEDQAPVRAAYQTMTHYADNERRDEPDQGPDDPVPPGRRPPRPIKEPPPLPENDDRDPPIEDPRPDKPKKL